MTAWTADEIETFNRRRVSLMRRGIAADLAESLAERLLGRDCDLDDRRLCLECANLSARTCRVLKVEAAFRAFMQDAQTNIILPRRKDDEVAARVRECLQQSMPVWLDLSAAAHAMHMSVSTLHRNLSQEGTTFQTLKDELRRDIAISRLITTNVPLGVLATELGFSDSAAFQRAFKCWTGSPPGEYRRSSERK